MTDHFNPMLSGDSLHAISALGLAHIGDAVFELMVRTWLCVSGASTAKRLHGGSIEFVSAAAQAAAAEKLLPSLTDEELDVYRRGRNTRVKSVPRGSTYEQYHIATGIEALFGYLYLSGDLQRVGELFDMIVANREME